MDLAVTTTVLVIVHEKVAEPADPLPSVAVRVTGVTPGVVGVPVMAPVELAMASPAGRLAALHVKIWPVVVSDAVGVSVEMADPVMFDLLPGLVTDTAPVTVQANEVEPANEAPSVAVMVTEHAHEDVGVPVMDPVEELIESPAGRPTALQVSVAPTWESLPLLVRVAIADPVTLDWADFAVTTTVLVVVQVKEALACADELSVAVRTTEAAPGVVGVPVTAPVEELIVSPAGRPVALQVSVAVELVSVALGVKVEMADPVTEDLALTAVTATVLVMVQVKLAEFE